MPDRGPDADSRTINTTQQTVERMSAGLLTLVVAARGGVAGARLVSAPAARCVSCALWPGKWKLLKFYRAAN